MDPSAQDTYQPPIQETVPSVEAPIEPAPPQTVTPISGGERVGLIDSLRGFAILGILLVNMAYFLAPIGSASGVVMTPSAPIDHYTELFIRFFAEAKFYVIFSFLFGVGMAVQAERFEATGRDFVPFFLKRMVILLLIGITHAVMIWSGDILVSYAIFGMILTLFYKVGPKWLLRWAIILFTIGFGIMILMYVGMLAFEKFSPAEANELWQTQLQSFKTLHEQAMAAYTQGSYLDAVKMRFTEWLSLLSATFYTFFSIMTSFLMGAFAWRKGIFLNLGRYEKGLKRWILYAGSIGLMANCILMMKGNTESMSLSILPNLGLHFAQYGVGFSYIAIFALLYHHGKLNGLFKALTPVGRMAMTNYLSHSVLCTLLFYNYGLDLMETGIFGAFYGLILTIAIFVAQIFFSRWWLSQYRFGPMEWLWRSLTYGKRQPMKREQSK